MVTTKIIHICDVCKDDSFKTYDEAEEHEQLPIIEGDYEGKVANCSFSHINWYGFIKKTDSVSKLNHERNYEFVLIYKYKIDSPDRGIIPTDSEQASITEIKNYLISGKCSPLTKKQLEKVNEFYKTHLFDDSRFPKPKSENGFESI
ncbi:MAG: hypothetical protein AB7V77_00675 [Candidatus Woesearchaeota archaeon]